jgi:hypothetical protein
VTKGQVQDCDENDWPELVPCEVLLMLVMLVSRLCTHPNALCRRISQSHNSSSSSIFVSRLEGMLPSELPLSFVLPISDWAKLFRTLSSKPGREARCFLYGEAMLFSGPGSGPLFAPAVDEEASFELEPATGVPERGDADAEDAVGPDGRLRGSAECWRFSCPGVSNVSSERKSSADVP